jgi:hypothetical protein
MPFSHTSKYFFRSWSKNSNTNVSLGEGIANSGGWGARKAKKKMVRSENEAAEERLRKRLRKK